MFVLYIFKAFAYRADKPNLTSWEADLLSLTFIGDLLFKWQITFKGTSIVVLLPLVNKWTNQC